MLQLASHLLLKTHFTLPYMKGKVICCFNFCKLYFLGIQTTEY